MVFKVYVSVQVSAIVDFGNTGWVVVLEKEGPQVSESCDGFFKILPRTR